MEEEPNVRVQLILDQAKRVERQVRILKQQLAQLRDDLQPKEAQGNGRTKDNPR